MFLTVKLNHLGLEHIGFIQWWRNHANYSKKFDYSHSEHTELPIDIYRKT